VPPPRRLRRRDAVPLARRRSPHEVELPSATGVFKRVAEDELERVARLGLDVHAHDLHPLAGRVERLLDAQRRAARAAEQVEHPRPLARLRVVQALAKVGGDCTRMRHEPHAPSMRSAERAPQQRRDGGCLMRHATPLAKWQAHGESDACSKSSPPRRSQSPCACGRSRN
jgi:hypothetical protein